MWYVESGNGQIRVEEKQYEIYGGDCFCFDLSKNHICTHNQKNPLVVYTIYFDVDVLQTPLKSKMIRNESVVGQAIKRAVEDYLTQNEEQAILWLQAVLQSFIRPKEYKVEIPRRIATICLSIENNVEKNYVLDEMSEMSGYSKNQIMRLFKKHFDLTPVQYMTKVKMEQAKKMMLYSNMTITEIGYSVGYEDLCYFTKVFKKYAGQSPTEYRNGIRGI